MRYQFNIKFDSVVTEKQATRVANKVGYQIKDGEFKPAKVTVKGSTAIVRFTLPKTANVGGVALNCDNTLRGKGKLRGVKGYKGMTFSRV